MSEDANLQPVVAAEFSALAGLLDAASAEQWDTPSLCEGWRVREVVAHLTMPARYEYILLAICGRTVPEGKLAGAPLR
jgi:uncharacterized protein (TIGR03083 family)